MAASTLRSERALSAWFKSLKSLASATAGYANVLRAEARWAAASIRPMEGWRTHAIGAPLIVSLTSSPRRFPTLTLTLKTLLTQTVRPDSVVLWLTPQEHAQLPGEVRSLRGVTIRHAPGIGCYKKIVPALLRCPGAFIAVADDDIYYPADWLSDLTAAYDPRRKEIPCHHALRIVRTRTGVASPFHWPAYDHPTASQVTFPVCGGGVLYPPYSLHPDVVRPDLFQALSPTSVDLWLFWMAQRAGYRYCKIKSRRELGTWPGVDEPAAMELRDLDAQFLALQQHFGWPRLDTERMPDTFTMSHRDPRRERQLALFALTRHPPLCSPRHAGVALGESKLSQAVLEVHDASDGGRAGDTTSGRTRSLP